MGVHGLWQLLLPISRRISIEVRFAISVACWRVRDAERKLWSKKS